MYSQTHRTVRHRQFQTETSLYYYRARYYNAAAGRFTSEDPLHFRTSSNFYQFVLNSPASLKDPTGRYTLQIGLTLSGTLPIGAVGITYSVSAGIAIDANGNTTTKSDSSGTTTYSWDFENRLSSVTLPGSGGTVSFRYDPMGRRIEKISPIATSVFLPTTEATWWKR